MRPRSSRQSSSADISAQRSNSSNWGRNSDFQNPQSAAGDVNAPLDFNQSAKVVYKKIEKSYTLDELLQVWSTLQQKLQSVGFEDKYRSLDPIRDLVNQVQHDVSLQQKKNTSNVAELEARLGEIDQWAQRENNGLDFASILSGVKSQRVQSPAPAAAFEARAVPLQRESSFMSAHSPLVSSASFLNTQQQYLQPADIKWEYLDPQGNLQGPFDGQMMENWYEGGYLLPTLQLKREGSNFMTLQEFVASVNNSLTPFLTPLPKAQPQTLQPTPHRFNQEQAQILQQQPQQQQQQQQQQDFSALDSSNIFGSSQSFLPQVQAAQQSAIFGSGRSSPWAPQSALGTPTLNGTQDFGIVNQSSFISNFNDNVSVAATASSSLVNVHERDDDIFNQIHSQVLNNVLTDETTNVSITPTTESNASPVVPAPSIDGLHVDEAIYKTVDDPAPISDIQPQLQNVPVQKRDAKKQVKAKAVEVKTEKPVAASKPSVAPWAKKASVSNAEPRLTLSEIQKLEAEKQAKNQKIKAEQDRLVAAQLLADATNSLKEAQVSNSKTSLPATATWASAKKPASTPTKSLLDIQREELAASAAATAASSLSTSSGVSKIAKHQPPSFASVASSPSNAWTTVTAKKPVVKPTAPHTTNQSSKQLTPDMLRSISAPVTSTTAGRQPSSSNKAVSPRQEFLAWCRSTMKLHKGIQIDGILELILELPFGPDSSEIIADTIYSNSSTMDGRRFSQEFMKRRKAVETQVNDGLSWTDALHISAIDDDDGWDFQVVKKKGKRRN